VTGGPRRGLLLDTHAFLWWATNDDRLSPVAREVIAEGRVLLSVATPWEMTIKHALGRLELRDAPRTLVYAQVARHGFETLGVSLEHVLGVADLPPHHDDPFDRLLIAQARVERLTIVTVDAAFSSYDVGVVW
jgi:PIN domain nuclease of toxin-antitoxin system